MNLRDVELLSAYLDGQLSPSDAARLEARLASDPQLKIALEDLRGTRGLLRRLPQRRAPRNFRLTPRMAGVSPPAPRLYPVFRFATALAALLFLASVALNAFTPFASQRLAAAPAPAYGMGGAGAGGDGGVGGGPGPAELTPPLAAEAAPAATEAPAAPLAAVAPTQTLEAPAAADAATAEAVQTEQALRFSPPANQASKAGPSGHQNGPEASPAPVPASWVIALGVLMLLCAAVAWLLRLNSDRRIRGRWNRR